MLEEKIKSILPLSKEERKEVLSHIPLSEWLQDWDLLAPEDALQLFIELPQQMQEELFLQLPLSLKEPLLKELPITDLTKILNQLQPDDLTDFFQDISDKDKTRLWALVSPKLKSELERLLIYSEKETGALMTTRYLTIYSSHSVKEALQEVRTYLNFIEKSYYIYVTNPSGLLCGAISIKELLLADDDKFVSDVMNSKVVHVNATDDTKESAELLESTGFPSLPVVDDYNHLIGLITFDDVIDFLRDEESESIYHMGGVLGEGVPYLESSAYQLVMKRLPWLIILMLVGTSTTNVLSHYQILLNHSLFLTLFIPIIMQTGGNSGTQSATLIIRGLAMGELKVRDVLSILFKELKVGVSIGVAAAVIVLLRSHFFGPNLSLSQGIIVGLALACVTIFSSITGALIPIALARMGRDPTVAAGPLMSTVVDIAGLTIYFELAKWILSNDF